MAILGRICRYIDIAFAAKANPIDVHLMKTQESPENWRGAGFRSWVGCYLSWPSVVLYLSVSHPVNSLCVVSVEILRSSDNLVADISNCFGFVAISSELSYRLLEGINFPKKKSVIVAAE